MKKRGEMVSYNTPSNTENTDYFDLCMQKDISRIGYAVIKNPSISFLENCLQTSHKCTSKTYWTYSSISEVNQF